MGTEGSKTAGPLWISDTRVHDDLFDMVSEAAERRGLGGWMWSAMARSCRPDKTQDRQVVGSFHLRGNQSKSAAQPEAREALWIEIYFSTTRGLAQCFLASDRFDLCKHRLLYAMDTRPTNLFSKSIPGGRHFSLNSMRRDVREDSPSAKTCHKAATNVAHTQ